MTKQSTPFVPTSTQPSERVANVIPKPHRAPEKPHSTFFGQITRNGEQHAGVDDEWRTRQRRSQDLLRAAARDAPYRNRPGACLADCFTARSTCSLASADGLRGQSLEHVLHNMNRLNRSLEEVIQVGNEFAPVESLWSHFEGVMGPREGEGEGEAEAETEEGHDEGRSEVEGESA